MTDTEQKSGRVYTFEELLNEQGFITYICMGFSMLPLLRQKLDVVEICKKPQGRCNKYDVVLYKRKNKYILHRILKVLPDGYLIAGDNLSILERDIKDENILGVMTRVIRNGKEITPDNTWYKLYVHLWCDVYPVRMFILKIRAFRRRCISFITRRFFKR